MNQPFGYPVNGMRTRLRAPMLAAAAVATLTASSSAIERTYQYFRFTPTVPASGNLLQLSEFRFYNGETALDLSSVVVENINGVGQSPGGEAPPLIVDGDTGTKWLNFNNSGTAGLVFDFGAPVTIDSYDFATANDALGRTPVNWTLEGSDDNLNWDVIDSVKGNPIPQAFFTFTPKIILPAVVLDTFASFEAIVVNGNDVELEWVTFLGTDVSISPGGLTGLNDSDFMFVSPPDDSDTTYTLTVSNPDETKTADVIIRSVAGGTANFQYVRFTPTKLRNDAAANSIQLAELQFLNDFDPVLPVAVTNPGGNTPAAEGPDKVNDEDAGTKWLDFNKSNLVYDFGAPVDIDSYYFVTANDAPERDPVRWTMEGSNDQTTWTLIDNVNAFDFPTPQGRQSFTQDIPLPGDSITPFIDFVGDAPFLVAGEPLVLTWDTQAATTVSIDQSIGTVAASGSMVVNPTVDTTYTITGTSVGGVTSTETFDVVIINPPITTIAYSDFDAAGDELSLLRNAQIVNDFENITAPGDFNRLRLTEDVTSQNGTAWFRKRIDASAGFSTTFGAQLISVSGNGGADGMCFMLQNDPLGTASIPQGAAEDGLVANALNIKLDSFFNEGDLSGAVVQVRAGDTVLTSVDLNTISNVVPLPGIDPNDLTMNDPDTDPYLIRIDYLPGTPNDLDVYFNNALVVDSLDVDLAAIGAVDGSGTGYVGFAGRSGGLFEAHDVTSWFLTEGPPPVAPATPGAFGIIDFSFDFAADTMDITWGSNDLKSYRITTSTDGLDWTTQLGPIIPGAAGLTQTSTTVPFTEDSVRLFRVEEE